MATSGKSTTNKSYLLGAQIAREDIAAGLPRRLTWIERHDARMAGEEVEYRPMPQPRGYYASDMERGYQDAWKALPLATRRDGK